MSGRGQGREQIDYAFPKDYEQLNSLLCVNQSKIKLKDIDHFQVQPEYDLPYKLLSMIEKCERFDNINQMNKHSCNYWLKTHTKETTKGRDYMFQMFGIYTMLGIKRDFKVGVPKENLDCDSLIQRTILKMNCQPKTYAIDKLIQRPILFLILVEQKLCDKLLVKKEMADIIEIAINSYEQNKQSNDFNAVQLELCREFIFFNDFVINKLRMVIDKDIYTYINVDTEEKINKIVCDYLDNCVQKETVKINYDKGESISFPKYMRSIIIGIIDEYKCLECIRPSALKSDNSFWYEKEIHIFEGVDKEECIIFWNYYYYSRYQQECEKMAESISEVIELPEKELENHIQEWLKKYYQFCIYTLFIISQETMEYKDLACDAFERLFSLYLFDVETNRFYEGVKRAVITIKDNPMQKSEDELELDMVKSLIKNFSSEVLYEIYYSPGLYHRVDMARYIIQIALSTDPYDGDNKYWDLLAVIDKINKEYFISENYCIRTEYFKNKKDSSLSKDKIKEKYAEYKKKYEECNEREMDGGYEGYYKSKFFDDMKSCALEMKYLNNYAKNKARDIVDMDESIGKKLIRFWVIFSSLVSKDLGIKII